MKQKRFTAPKRSLLYAVAIATTSLLLVTSPALAAPQGNRGNGPQGPGGFGGQGPGHGPFMGGVFRQLDLSEDQRTQVRETIQQYMDGQLGELMRQQRQTRQELRRIIHDPTTDESAIIEAVRNSSAAAEQFALERHRLSVALFDLLDEQQRAQAMQLLEELPDQQFRGRRGQRRGGPGRGNQPDY